MKLHHLRPAPGSRKAPQRVGRGPAGKGGKTAGRGTKGTKARRQVPIGFEGGQMPIARRFPKLRGFSRPAKEYFAIVNVERLERFPARSEVGPEQLRSAGLIKRRGRVKVLGQGQIDRPLMVRAHAFSLGAAEKIQNAGGTVEVIAETKA